MSCFSASSKSFVLRPFSISSRALASIAPAAGVGLHAALAPAGAAGAVLLDDDVADLAGVAAPGPGLSVKDHAAAHAGAPENSEQRVEGSPGAEPELGLGGHLDVAADPHRAS